MSLDRISCTSPTTNTVGPLTLVTMASARPFSDEYVGGAGDLIPYTIEGLSASGQADGSFECGDGTFNLSGQFERTSPLYSSDGVTIFDNVPYAFPTSASLLVVVTISEASVRRLADEQVAVHNVDANAHTGVFATASGLSNHIGDTNNPHSVTAAQVGLGNADNTSDANKPVSTAQQIAIDAKVTDAIVDGVTDVAPSQNAVFDALTGKADASALSSHIGDTNNPHSVTAAQVGNSTAQWNASQLQGQAIATTAPSSSQVLAWNGTAWEASTISGSIVDRMRFVDIDSNGKTVKSDYAVTFDSNFAVQNLLLVVVP